MRIAQLVLVPVAGLELVEVDELPASERGVARLRLRRHCVTAEPRDPRLGSAALA